MFVSGWSGWNQYLWRGEDIRYQIPEGTAVPTPVTIILFIFVWGVMREKIQPFLPSNMASFKRISEMMVKKAIFKIKKRVRELEMS